MNRRVRAVVRKEFRELRKDPITLWIAIFVPVLLLVVFAYAIRLDVSDVPLAVVDLDRSAASAGLVESIVNTGHFRVVEQTATERGLRHLLDDGSVRIGIVIPPGFGRALASGDTARVQTLIDGSYPATAAIVRNELDAVTATFAWKTLNAAAAGSLQKPVTIEPRVWYNPALRSETFVVPGLFAVILMAFPPLLTVLAIVREKETGSIRQLQISPLRDWEFITGKLTAYSLVAFTELTLVMGLGTWWFHVPFRGSLGLLLVSSILYVTCTVSIGLLVSTLTRSQVVAMLLALIITVMPSFLFSGFMFPISSMARPVQWYSHLFPARYFVDVSRGIFLKGVGVQELAAQLLVLVGYTVAVLAAAISRFHKRLA